MNNETVFGIFKTDTELKDFMLDFLKCNFEDFRACENEFDISITNLRNYLSEEKVCELNELIASKYRQIIVGMKYEIMLGMKANYDYYESPATNDFLECDIGIYTQEKKLSLLPAYIEEQRKIMRLNKSLDIDEGEFYDGIREYFIYLDTVCPKLSHFLGYLIGNQVFSEIVSGYTINIEHIMKYTSLLEDYFGCKLDISEQLLPDNTD